LHPHTDRQVAALDIAGRNLSRDAAYYLAFYRDYLGRAVAPCGILYGKVRYRVRLVDDAVRDAVAELGADCVLIRLETVRRNLWQADHALPQISDKLVSAAGVALAGEVGDDGAVRG